MSIKKKTKRLKTKLRRAVTTCVRTCLEPIGERPERLKIKKNPPRMYCIGVHDNSLFIKLDINTTHFLI